MLHTQTWRTLLADIIDDPLKCSQIAHSLHVRPATLVYWMHSNARPHLQQLRDLLKILPMYDSSLSPLMADEIQRSIDDACAVMPDDIPQAFRDRFHAGVRHPVLPREMRIWSLGQLALQQMVAQLDPHRLGLLVKIVRCMPSSLAGKVRSLYEYIGMGTSPWQHNLEHNALFLGCNSLTGHAIAIRHSVVNDCLPSASEYEQRVPTDLDYEASTVACPLMHDEGVAGCLYFASVYEAYFSPPRLQLIQRYAELVASIFEPDDFHQPDVIELWDMPSLEFQQRYLATLRPRIFQLMQEQHLPFTVAEGLAWQQIEQELFQVLW